MIRGLLLKSLYEVWVSTLLFAVGLALVMGLLTFILPQVQEGMTEVLAKIPFVKTLIAALLGTELGDDLNARMMQSILWVHPVVLSLVWGHEIVLSTRMPAGEIDRGTIDILLGLPVSRRAVYFCESLVLLVSGGLVLLAGLVGHLLMAPTMPAALQPQLSRVLLIMVNLYCVYIAVGGISLLVSALCDRRGRAIAIIFSLVLASFLLNFLAQFWDPAGQLAFLSVMNYYRPAPILRSGELPVANIAVLLGTGIVAWLAGGEVLARRSICTV